MGRAASAGLEEEVTALVGAIAGEDPETFSSWDGKCASIAPIVGRGLQPSINVLMDLAEPHFSEMEVVPASLSPHREQRSRVPKMIQRGTQPQTKMDKREMK